MPLLDSSAPGDIAASGDASGDADSPADQPDGRVVDGRRARRERNRNAVVDALLGFYRDGVLQPSTDQIAERAGISARSLFRYFADVDDLCRAAIGRQLEHVGHLVRLEVDPSGTTGDRVALVVAGRLDLFDAMSWVGVVARTREPYQPLIADELRTMRRMLRDHLREAFAVELARFDRATADERVVAADVLCSFESYRLMRDDHGLDRAAAAGVVGGAMLRLLAGDRPGARS